MSPLVFIQYIKLNDIEHILLQLSHLLGTFFFIKRLKSHFIQKWVRIYRILTVFSDTILDNGS